MKMFKFILLPLLLLSAIILSIGSLAPSATAGTLNTQPVTNFESSVVIIIEDLSMIVTLTGFAILMMVKLGAIKDPNIKAGSGNLIIVIILSGIVYSFAAYGVTIFTWIANFFAGLFS